MSTNTSKSIMSNGANAKTVIPMRNIVFLRFDIETKTMWIHLINDHSIAYPNYQEGDADKLLEVYRKFVEGGG